MSSKASIPNGNEQQEQPVDKDEEPQKVGCCRWLLAELPVCGSLPAFSSQDPNGKTIDFDKSFCTGDHRPTWDIVLVKFVLWGLTISTYILGFFDSDYPHFYMAFISYWTLLYSTVYMTLSLMLSFMNRPSSFLINATWVMYTNASVHGLMVVLLFWLTEYGPNFDLRYFIIMSHGASLLMTIMDGAWINQTPVRLKHYLFVWVFGLLFVGWTILQAMLPIDNPFKDGDAETGEGENLYNILDWVDAPYDAAAVSVGVLFVAMPVLTVLVWGLSLCKRHYVVDGGDQHTDEEEDEKTDRAGNTEDAPDLEFLESADC